MKKMGILFALLILTSVSFAYDLNVTFFRSDYTTAHFCNPCNISVSNTSGFVAKYGLTSGGLEAKNNHTFTGLIADDFEITLTADLIGFEYEIIENVALSANTDLEIALPVDNKGSVGTITGAAALGMENLTNATVKTLGFDSLNAYNGFVTYAYTDTVALSEFQKYDVMVVTAAQFDSTFSCTIYPVWESVISDSVANAVIASQSFIIAGVGQEKLWSLLSIDGIAQQYNGDIAGTNYRHQTYFDSVGQDDYETFWSSETTGSNKWRSFEQTGVYTYPSIGDRVCTAEPNITTATHYDGGRFCLNTSTAAACINYNAMTITDGSIVLAEKQAYKSSGTPTDYDFASPYLSALTWYSLFGVDSTLLTVSAYEGTEKCGKIKPVANVLCCLGTDCSLSESLTANTINTSSLVTPTSDVALNQRGDSSEPFVFYNSYADFTDTEYGWKNNFLELSNDEQSWYVYKDSATKTARVSFAGSRGSTDGNTQWLMAYDFYDTYYDTSKISDIGFSIEPVDSNNAGELVITQYVLGVYWTTTLRTCETNDYWNMSLFYGKNETAWNEEKVLCDNGAISFEHNYSQAYIPHFDISQITWHYGYAPDFMVFDEEFIGVNDSTPMKKLQSNTLESRYNFIRHMIVAKFTPKVESGTDITTDTGAYIELINNSLNYSYTQYAGGTLELHGYGNKILSCTAPTGYSFYDPAAETYSRYYVKNVSIFNPTSLGIMLQKTRPLNLVLHITSDTVEDIDNARCSINGYTDTYSTNGYCYFNDVQPNSIYNLTVTTSGAVKQIVERQIGISDYYDSDEASTTGFSCAGFDGNYTVEVDVDVKQLTFTARVQTDTDGVRVGNVVVTAMGEKSCRTDFNGECEMKLLYKSGLPYVFGLSKHPQIMDYNESIYIRAFSFCSKADTCTNIFEVSTNGSYAGDVNDDVDYMLGEDSNNPIDVMYGLLGLFTNYMFLGFIMVFTVTYIGFSTMGIFGGILGWFGGTAIAVIGGFLPASALLLFLLVGIIAIAVVGSGLFGE